MCCVKRYKCVSGPHTLRSCNSIPTPFKLQWEQKCPLVSSDGIKGIWSHRWQAISGKSSMVFARKNRLESLENEKYMTNCQRNDSFGNLSLFSTLILYDRLFFTKNPDSRQHHLGTKVYYWITPQQSKRRLHWQISVVFLVSFLGVRKTRFCLKIAPAFSSHLHLLLNT